MNLSISTFTKAVEYAIIPTKGSLKNMTCSCSCSLSLYQGPSLKLLLRAPNPPQAVRGLEGMKVADAILKQYNVAGLLIGGIAKSILRGNINLSSLARHKDVDVLICSVNCEEHPEQWEGGVDWWISHGDAEKPTNGCCNILANILFYAEEPGLHIPEPNALWHLAQLEKTEFADENKISFGPKPATWKRERVGKMGYKLIPATISDWPKSDATHCKMRQ